MNLALSLMEKAARQGSLAHLLLFHGGAAEKKREAGLRLAKILNCLNPHISPCEQCPACRKISSGNHPDVVRLTPEKTSIGIEQVLAWQEKVYRKHYEGNYKVFMIEQAESLTLPAANALLKVIEEPPEKTVIILSAENANSLLPTIQSRAQAVYFPYLTEQEWIVGQAAESADINEVEKAFRLSGANPDLAREILSLGVTGVQEWLDRFWLSVTRQDFSKLFALFPIEKEAGTVYVQLIARQIEEKIQSGELAPRAVWAASRALEALTRQANPRLVIEVLMLELSETLNN